MGHRGERQPFGQFARVGLGDIYIKCMGVSAALVVQVASTTMLLAPENQFYGREEVALEKQFYGREEASTTMLLCRCLYARAYAYTDT